MQPNHQKFHLDGVRHISAVEAFNLLKEDKAMLIDVREKEECEVERVNLENVKNYPMTEIIDNLKHLPEDILLITMDSIGERGTKVANLLNIKKFKHVANLDGGLVQWRAENLPDENILPDACGCSSCCS
ncbi:MAG: rhodanese-like domain-containing protein [Bacteroidales bacterium]|nr:rhodanese-like domain-containing protein [Bacteroidales bacterium]MCF8326747.1 rhodanese-like domain-containing protein [Bacteroidales bacterium]